MNTGHARITLATLILGVITVGGIRSNAEPIVRADYDAVNRTVRHLSWDTEGGPRADTNLLRPQCPVSVHFSSAAQTVPADATGANAVAVTKAADRLEWVITPWRPGLTCKLVFPFDPRVTPTTALPASWEADGTFRLPAVINAPDFGPMLLTGSGEVRGRLEGNRADKRVDLLLDISLSDKVFRLALSPLLLPPPASSVDAQLWRSARRGWLNAVQPSSRWGEQDNAFSAPAGMLANNTVSDPASCSLWFYADQVYWMPQVAPGVSLAPLVRRTIEYWLDQKTKPNGEVVGYWHYYGFLDANAGPIIAAWDYVECSGGKEWLTRKIEKLELVADYLLQRDIDHDGMIEATQSGNLGTLVQPNRSCAWWDALNCGHKDGYTNAVIYRAFRCLADLERGLGRDGAHQKYTRAADQLKAAYAKTLFNPQTGWLAWWKSQDGQLHDYASPTLNGIAIEYGLVEPQQGRQILDKLWAKIDAVGFKRFDLGIPPMLVPVRHGDYLLPEAIGMPQREDGTDTFGQYMNGGITAGHVLHFLAAHYTLGQRQRADRVLGAMLGRQMRGEFQNGVTDAAMKGIDWTTWDGQPCGYEGYLADSFRFLQAVVLREQACRDRFYRPLNSR